LKSTAGSYHFAGGCQHDQLSQCLDSGNPSTPFVLEPQPNGGRVDLGAYGATEQASLSVTSRQLVLYSPVGGELWSTVHSVYWLASGGWETNDRVRLEVSRDAGQTWQTVVNAAALPYDLDHFEWDVRAVASSGRCRVRVTAVEDPAVKDESEFNFFIHHGE